MQQKPSAQSMDIQRVISVLLRRRKLICGTTALLTLTALVLCVILPNTYEAVSTVLINNTPIIDPIVAKLAVSPDINQEINTLKQQVFSFKRMESMINALKLAPPDISPRKLNGIITDLRRRMLVEMRGNDLVEISFRDKVPARAQQVVNTVTENFILENSRQKQQEARDAIAFIESQLKIYQQKLESSQKNFSSSKIANEMRLNYNRRQMLQEQMKNLERLIPSQVRSEQNPVLVRLQARLREIDSELARLMVDAREGNPKIAELRRQRQQVKTFIDGELQTETVKESVSIINPTYLQYEQELKQLDLEMEDLARRKKEMEGRNALVSQPVTEDELANLERNKTVDEDIYQVLLRQLESAYVSEHLQSSEKGRRFIVLEYARLPLAPVSPNRFKLLLIGLLGGLCAGMGLAFLVEQLDRSFKTIDEAKDSLTMDYLGVVSKIVPDQSTVRRLGHSVWTRLDAFMNRHRLFTHLRLVAPTPLKRTSRLPISPEVITVHQPQTMIMEEFRVIKSNIENCFSEQKSVALAVTSSLKSEGKSTTAANIAVTMALSGRKTLLVDADLRRGRVHDLFGLSQSPGLTEVINKTAPLERTLMVSGIENLTLLPRGVTSHRAYDKVGSAHMKEIITELKTKYDVVLFDTPPVLSLPDTIQLSKHLDGIVLVIQAERTQAKDVLNAQEAIIQAHANVLGYVLTNVQYYIPRSLYQYYYYGAEY